MRTNSGCGGRWSRLLKKRELLAYYLLCKKKGVEKWNIGDALEVLMKEMIMSRKIAFSVIRRLRRLGLLGSVDKNILKCASFEDYFDELFRSYVCSKRMRIDR